MSRHSGATAIAPSNIAFVKYWGARDLGAAIPWNPSISMSLTHCVTRCTVEHRPEDREDEVLLRAPDGERIEQPAPEFTRRVVEHLARIRERTGARGAFRVVTGNSFPSAAGLASSASGFAALTLAATGALGLELSPDELSTLARLSGSGSAARSVLGGYVEWPVDDDPARCHARVLAPAEHWDLRDVIALVDSGPKKVSSLDGHRRAATSPHFEARQRRLPGRLRTVREAIVERDLERLGAAVEQDAIELHLIAMSSSPPIFYWQPGTLRALAAVRSLREDGVPAYATMDAGPNVHVICGPDAEDAVAARLEALPEVRSVIRDRVGPGPRVAREDA